MANKFLLKNLLLTMLVMLSSLTLTSCGDDKDEPKSDVSLIGTWKATHLDQDGGVVTLTFKTDGKCAFSETFADEPEYNYTVTVNYALSGDLSDSATLELRGYTVDGYYVEIVYLAKISGSMLTLNCIRSTDDEDIGEMLVLQKQ